MLKFLLAKINVSRVNIYMTQYDTMLLTQVWSFEAMVMVLEEEMIYILI